MESWAYKAVFAIGLTALTILLTGPGMWSERWGWWWVKRRDPSDPPGGAGDGGRP